MTFEELPEFIGAKETQALLGLTREQTNYLFYKEKDFPSLDKRKRGRLVNKHRLMKFVRGEYESGS